MPGYQFNEQEFTLVKDSLRLRYSIERMAYYKLLCDALGTGVTFDISDNYFVDCGVFIIKKVEAVDEHTRLADVCRAKLALFEAEHRGNSEISEADTKYITQIKAELKQQEDILSKIRETFDLLTSLKQLINRLEGNAPNYNWKRSYPKSEITHTSENADDNNSHPLADFWSPNDRLLGPTDTLIG